MSTLAVSPTDKPAGYLRLAVATDEYQAWKLLVGRQYDIVILDRRQSDPGGQTWIFLLSHLNLDPIGLHWQRVASWLMTDLSRLAQYTYISMEEVPTVVRILEQNNPICS